MRVWDELPAILTEICRKSKIKAVPLHAMEAL
jgi:hypothetical protein